MNRKNLINRILCAVLILALAAGAAVAAFTGGRTPPEDPLEHRAQALNADPVDGGSSSQRREWQEREDTAPEQEDNEPAETPQEEEPHKEEQPEDREQPDRKTEPRWYDPLHLPGTLSKKGRNISAGLEALEKEAEEINNASRDD